MPPKIGSHSKAAEDVADLLFDQLSKVTGSKGQPSFESCVLAFVDKPGIATALGFPDDTNSVDIQNGARILCNIKDTVSTTLSTSGPRHTEKKRIIESISSAITGDNVTNLASIARITGISADILRRGKKLRDENKSANASSVASCIPINYTHAYPLEQVHEWYHTHACTNVMLDKSEKKHYKRKLFKLPNEMSIKLSCEPRILLTSREELAQSYLDSDQHKRLLQEDGRRSLCVRTAQACICDCIKEAKNSEMICPICIGFKYLIDAWEKMRTDARRNGESCSCSECVPGSKWFLASQNLSSWRQSSTCGKIPHRDLENPADGITPHFCRLQCSLMPKEKSAKRKRETEGTPDFLLPDYYPPYAGEACKLCGWANFAPGNCTVEMSDKPCKWMEKQGELGPRGEDIYDWKFGTRKELIDLIQEKGPRYNYHKWIHQWTRHQHALDNETFNGRTEISITTDFGASYDMKQQASEKCSHGTSCNQLVALVLHSPGIREISSSSSSSSSSGSGSSSGDPKPRPVKCDVWRFWSQKKGNAAFHQMAIKEIAAYYKQNVLPELRAVKVKTDGQRSQYKGHKNLGEVAEWPHPKLPLDECKNYDCLCLEGEKACKISFLKPGQDLELIHDFSCSHHGSGPVDSFSKDASHGMDSDVATGKSGRYN
jgi:hypothetical protein